MYPSKNRSSVLGAALLVGLAMLAGTRGAQASSSFPPKLQQGLETEFPGQAFCVPQCTACHTTNVGGFGTLNSFGLNLRNFGGLAPVAGNPVTSLHAYFEAVASGKTNGDSDGDGISDEAELKALSSPAVAGTRGEGQLCPDIRYGCGARMASAPPPVDRLGLLSAGFALLGLTALRRRSRRH